LRRAGRRGKFVRTMSATLTFPCNSSLHSAAGQPPILVRSADELRKALRTARQRAVTVDLSGLNRLLRLDGSRRLVELQAAAPWSALQEHGVTSALQGTIGDAVSANVPGMDGRPVVCHVEAVTLVTPDGEVRRADRRANQDLFALAIGGHGLFGVPYSLTLRLDSLLRSMERPEESAILEVAGPCSRSGATRTVEFLAAPERLDSVLADARSLATDRRIVLQRIAVRRLHPERETFLRWATQEWAEVRLEYGAGDTLGACVLATEVERLLLDIALANGGSFRIDASPNASLAQLQRGYPQLADFLAQKKRLDPAERLQNAWYRRIAAQLRGPQLRPL
jgi:FAD/FMN-containing dehydrogenase